MVGRLQGSEVALDSSSGRGSEGESISGSGAAAGTGLTLSIEVWGACLGLALAASVFLMPVLGPPGPASRVAFHAATGAIYLVVFAHCLMRLGYSRSPSWLLFTAGFAALCFASILGVATSVGLVQDQFLRVRCDLLRAAMLPSAAALLLAAAHASRARARGHRPGAWKGYARLVLVAGAFIVAWRSGACAILGQIVAAASIDVMMAVDIASAAALAALLHRTLRVAASSHDEIVVPICYWTAAMLLGTVLSLAMLSHPQSLWWQIRGLELGGIAALLVGLSLENERAHRQAAEKMADLEAMQRISWSLVGAAGLAELSAALARATSDGFSATPVAVYLAGDNDEELVVAATSRIDDPSVAAGRACSLRAERRPAFHSGHTSRAFATGSVQCMREIFSDVEFLPWRTVAREEGTVVSVPLPYQGNTIGVVNLFLAGVTSIGETRIRLLEAIAAAVSPAIENARLRSAPSGELKQAA